MFRLFVLFCLVLSCQAQAHVTDEENSGRVVNGQIINIVQAPHLVQLRQKSNNQLFCGGSMISEIHILTAAHCFDAMSPYDTVVVAEANTRSDVGIQRTVASYVKSPYYTPTTMHMDYAVLKLNSPMVGQLVRPLKLCSKPVYVGKNLQVSGWGFTSHNGPGSHELRTVSLPAISQPDCSAMHGYANPPISNAMICAYNPRQDVCFADSGSAAIVDGELCGIVSWGRGCAIGIPSIFTNVFGIVPYIQDAMQKLN